MAPHLSGAEIDIITAMAQQGKGTKESLVRITRDRDRKGVEAPELRAVQRVVAGTTYCRGKQETRGRKRKWSPAMPAHGSRRAQTPEPEAQSAAHALHATCAKGLHRDAIFFYI